MNKEIFVLIENSEKNDDVKAKWTRAYINNLPDSAFLHVESGGEKDEDDRTVPRSLRHLPYKSADGSIDLPHLRNAISRLGQPVTGETEDDGKWLTEALRKRLQTKARKILADEQKSVSDKQVEILELQSELFVSDEKQDKNCMCPSCGYISSSEKGKQCRESECPECGSKMVDKAMVGEAEEQTVGENTDRALISQISSSVDAQVKEVNDQVESDDELERDNDKAGRRVRGDKVNILQRIVKEFEDVKKALVDFIGWSNYEDSEQNDAGISIDDLLNSTIATKAMEQADEHGSSLISFKGLDGKDWLLTFTTNAFRDREDEIFTTKSIEEYVSRHENQDIKGEYQFWHLPGTKFGDILWQGVSGRFLVEAGTYDDTIIGNAFKQFFTKYPNGHPEISDSGWGCSHKYEYKSADRDDGVYEWFEKSETTVLPLDAAANPYTSPVFLMKEFKMNEKQRKALELIGGATVVRMVEEVGKKATSELEATVDFKAKKPSLMEELEAIAGDMEDGEAKKAVLGVVSKMGKMPPWMEKKPEEKKESGEEKKEDADVEATPGLAPEPESGVNSEQQSQVSKQEPEPEVSTESSVESESESEKEYRDAVAQSFVTLAESFSKQINGLVSEVKGLREELKQVKRDDEVKIAEKAELTPAASLLSMVKRAVGAQETKADGRSAWAKEGPQQADQTANGPSGVPMLDMFITNSDQKRQ